MIGSSPYLNPTLWQQRFLHCRFFLKGGWGGIKFLTHDSRLQANDRVAWESGMASPEVRKKKKLATLDDHIIPRGGWCFCDTVDGSAFQLAS